MAFDDLDKLESYEESNKRSFFNFKDNDGKTVAIELLDLDAERPSSYDGTPAKHVKLNLIVNEGNGQFTEYYGQWVKGAVVYGFFSKRKKGESFIRKVVQLPPQKKGQQGAWAFNSTDEASFNETLEHVKAKTAEAEKALESVKDDELPWASSDD